jgi:hypothetical protein
LAEERENLLITYSSVFYAKILSMAAAFFKKHNKKVPLWLMRRLFNIWPPYLGAGIKILEGSDDFRYIKTCLKRRWYNLNYVGTAYGGSLYSMTDPFYMFMLINILGRDYIVWDKGAEIDFVSPGKTDVFAEFKITDEIIEDIKTKTAEGNKYIFTLPVEVKDKNGNLVANVNKVLYVRKKKN